MVRVNRSYMIATDPVDNEIRYTTGPNERRSKQTRTPFVVAKLLKDKTTAVFEEVFNVITLSLRLAQKEHKACDEL